MAVDALSFGIKTRQENVTYREILRVWREADEIDEIEHAWLFDHLLPLWTDNSGPIYEAWTLLAALAAQTQRLRVGLIVTSNRLRFPAMLAKIAATVDAISDGRLDFGFGIGGRPSAEPTPEYEAYGIPNAPWRDAVASFAEACVLIRRLWTEDIVDFNGHHYRLVDAWCNPKPVQRPHPPILIGGAGAATLPIVAEHADIWNMPCPNGERVEQLRRQSRLLDERCAAIGRDPREITRSAQIPVSYDDPAPAVQTLRGLIDAGFTHLVLMPAAPYPEGVARWVADNLIRPFVSR
jgi:alkanesulfonate monooxygenase SsuD/methylene tetrahydromethanopterin reductase-like flavin-dependent oxidoreductase (luciferase family)